MRLFYFYICSMVDITQVYEILRDLCNKDQRGFVTQNEFNNFAAAAQSKIYNEIFKEVFQANKLRRQQVDGKGAMSLLRQKQEDLSYYLAEYDLLVTDEVLEDYYESQQNEDGALAVVQETQIRYVKPTDIKYVVAVYRGGEDSLGASATPCEVIRDASKYRRVLNSRLSHPTDAFPIAFISDRTIVLSPSGGERANMTYYRQARSRYAAVQTVYDFEGGGSTVTFEAGALDVNQMPTLMATEGVNGVNIIDHLNTRNFDLPEHYMDEVIMEMAHMIGMNVRDTALMQYGLKMSNEQ